MNKPKSSDKPLIILTAGGTGGHVYPAEALAEELEKRNYALMLITDNRGKDNYKGKLGQIPNYAVLSGGIVGKSKLFKIKSLAKTFLGIMQATWLLWRKKPLCVVGFGGYASFPASVAAILTGTPLVLHEQNSVMSRTNRLLCKYAEFVAQSFKNVKYAPDSKKNVLCGMPVRAAIVEAAKLPYPKINKETKLQILVLGGSQGAKIFGEVIPQTIKELGSGFASNIKIYQQCRKGEEENILSAYNEIPADITVSHFFDNMAELYSSSHIIITRSGASSISEIAVVGLPSILVPLPSAADDHQTSNAKELSDAGAGIVIHQSEFNSAKLKDIILEWSSNPDKLQDMSNAAKKVGINNAANRFADEIEKRIVKH